MDLVTPFNQQCDRSSLIASVFVLATGALRVMPKENRLVGLRRESAKWPEYDVSDLVSPCQLPPKVVSNMVFTSTHKPNKS